MTISERRSLSERIATLAEQAGLPSELVWEAAETCPQGHSNRDMECGYIDLEIGGLCRECWTEEWRNPRLEMCETDTEIDAVVDEEMAAYPLFGDPAFHPEGRIGKQAKDFTDPANLLAIVEHLRLVVEMVPRKDATWSVGTDDGSSPRDDFLGRGRTHAIREAWALSLAEALKALEQEKGAQR